jgi:hypothetical protein
MIERMNIIDDRGINMDQYWVMENETLNPIWPRNDVTRSLIRMFFRSALIIGRIK